MTKRRTKIQNQISDQTREEIANLTRALSADLKDILRRSTIVAVQDALDGFLSGQETLTSLRARTIRLAYLHPELRSQLLPLLVSGA